MRIHVIARDIQRHDAVGNCCRQMQRFLSDHGFDVALAAENVHPDDRPIISLASDIISRIAVDDVTIFHFSTEDPAFPVIAALANPKIVYFHNITPESFFVGIDENAAHHVRNGLAQRPLAARFDVLMSNSRASARVLYEGLAPADRSRLQESQIIDCPPVIGAERWNGVPEDAAPAGVDENTILYVGRLVAHKSVLQLIEGFAVLAMTNQRVSLLCVGGPAVSAYMAIVAERVAALDPAVARRISFVSEISDGMLRSIYEKVGVCASMSQHEGFGVPLLDALIFDKPLVIYAQAGMMETAGDAAVIVKNLEPATIAGALAAALDEAATRERLARARPLRLATLRRLCDGRSILSAVNLARDMHRARIV